MRAITVLLGLLCMTGIGTTACRGMDPESGSRGENREKPETPRIDCVVPGENQPHQNDPAVIWYDDFNGGDKKYLESTGDIDTKVFFGSSGGAMKAGFKAGETVGEGNRKIAFGDFPGTDGSVVRAGETFDEIYWRIYVRHEYGWQGSPAKMSRATSIVSPKWRQAMISHVWSGKKNSITLDPASGIDGQSAIVRTTKYNDFENLNWLGNAPSSTFQISSTEESGTWVLVEAHTKLNTPGKSDGQARLWIDGRLEAIRENLNFRGSYTGHGINAVFLESYWNSGSVKTQGRWFDNFVVSTKFIGPVVCPSNPTLYKTPYHGPGSLAIWEVQLATDDEGNDIIFRSKHLETKEQVVINLNSGNFSGSLKGESSLSSDKSYFCRVRQQSTNGEWSAWSRWHQHFKVENAP